MTTSTPSSTFCPPDDLPIIVRDRRRRGFFTIDNVVLDHYGKELKPTGIATYAGLARFANREGVCFPSQTTLANLIGMSRMQVSREIDKLKRLHLIEVQPQVGPHGEQRSNLYILLDVPEEEEGVTHRYTLSNRPLYPPVTGSDTPRHRQLHKQNPENKTQTEQDTEEQPVVVALPSASHAISRKETRHKGQNEKTYKPTPTAVIEPAESEPARADHNENSLSAAQQPSAAALITIGLAETVARQLAEHYSPTRIAEKIEYLAYLQAEHPEKVLKPCGWLRKAIEEDYAAPDGYQSVADRTAEAAERKRREEEHEQFIVDQREQERAAQAQARQKETERLAALHATYGTTQQELALWQSVLQEFQLTMPSTSFALYVADTLLLSVHNGEALIGLPNARARDWLQNRFASKIQRTLASYLGGQKVSVKFIEMNPLAHEVGGGGLRC